MMTEGLFVRMKTVRLLLLLPLLWSCSLSVPGTHAPTNPPHLDNKSFEAHLLNGDFVQVSAPQMFFWPTERISESGEIIQMTLEEQAESRRLIAYSAEQLQYYEAEIARVQMTIQAEYSKKSTDLESDFTEQRCYSYCNPEDFIFCDPDDDTVLFIDDWMVSEDEEIAAAIRSCQENQQTREGLEEEKAVVIQEQVGPLREQISIHGQNFFGALGDNYLLHFKQLKLKFDDEQTQVELMFADTILSTATTQGDLKIRDVKLDRLNGFLEFTANAFDPQNQLVGVYEFDLELTFLENGLLKVDGDVRWRQDGDSEMKVGRVVVAGQVVPNY